MEEQEVYEKAIKKWGRIFQHLMLFEEMAELQKAVIKLMREKDPIIMMDKCNDVIEELVDVEIMLEQLKVLLNMPDATIFYIKKREKLEKLKKIVASS